MLVSAIYPTWISHRYTYVPFLLNLHLTPKPHPTPSTLSQSTRFEALDSYSKFLLDICQASFCNFPGSVSLQQKIWSEGQTTVTALCYSSVLLGKQRIVHSWGMRAGWSKRRGLNPSWLPPFISLSPPNPEPALCKLDWPWRGCICFTWSSHSGLQIFFHSHFCRLFPFFVF